MVRHMVKKIRKALREEIPLVIGMDAVTKNVSISGKLILKVAAAAWEFLGFDELWNRCARPPVSCWT